MDPDLTPQQEAAITALISEPTITAAAVKAGVNRRTIYNYLDRPEFQEAYKEARRAVYGNAQARLQVEAEASVATLAAIRDAADVPASTRLQAAYKILDLAHTAHDLTEIEDLVDRIKAADNG